MADSPMSRAGTTSISGVAAIAAAMALGLCGVLALFGSADRGADQATSPDIAIVRSGTTQTSSSTVVAPPQPGGDAIAFELHGIDGATAWLAIHDAKPQRYRAGDALSPTVTLVAVRRSDVLLREGGRLHRLDLPPRLGGSDLPVAPGREGLSPSPQPPTGELSGAVIAERLAATPPPTPLPGDADQGGSPADNS